MKKRNIISLTLLLIILPIFCVVNNRTGKIEHQYSIPRDITEFSTNSYYKRIFPDVVLKSIESPTHGAILEVSGKVSDEETLLKLKKYFNDRAYSDMEEYKKHLENAPMFKSVAMNIVVYKVEIEQKQD